MEKENIKSRLAELHVEFKRLDRQRLAAAELVQKIAERQVRLQGAFEELNNLMPEGERVTEESLKEQEQPQESKKE